MWNAHAHTFSLALAPSSLLPPSSRSCYPSRAPSLCCCLLAAAVGGGSSSDLLAFRGWTKGWEWSTTREIDEGRGREKELLSVRIRARVLDLRQKKTPAEFRRGGDNVKANARILFYVTEVELRYFRDREIIWHHLGKKSIKVLWLCGNPVRVSSIPLQETKQRFSAITHPSISIAA